MKKYIGYILYFVIVVIGIILSAINIIAPRMMSHEALRTYFTRIWIVNISLTVLMLIVLITTLVLNIICKVNKTSKVLTIVTLSIYIVVYIAFTVVGMVASRTLYTSGNYSIEGIQTYNIIRGVLGMLISLIRHGCMLAGLLLIRKEERKNNLPPYSMEAEQQY